MPDLRYRQPHGLIAKVKAAGWSALAVITVALVNQLLGALGLPAWEVLSAMAPGEVLTLLLSTVLPVVAAWWKRPAPKDRPEVDRQASPRI